MKKLLLLSASLLSLNSYAFVNVKANVDSANNYRAGQMLLIKSYHEFFIRNQSNATQIYHYKTTLCVENKGCDYYGYDITLAPTQTYESHDFRGKYVYFGRLGNKNIVAKTEITGGETGSIADRQIVYVGQ